MPEWEYKVIYIYLDAEGNDCSSSVHRPPHDVLDLLTKYGPEGWQLVRVIRQNLAPKDRRLEAIMKGLFSEPFIEETYYFMRSKG